MLKAPQIRLCKDCMNLVTTVVDKDNIIKTPFFDSEKVNNKIVELGKVRVWRCKKSQLENEVYIDSRVIEDLNNNRCTLWEGEDE